jgi:hydrogenase-4 membrane subunit HyfE
MALTFIAIGCLLLIYTVLLLNDFLSCRIALLSDYGRYSKQILPVILSGLATFFFIGLGFFIITKEKND